MNRVTSRPLAAAALLVGAGGALALPLIAAPLLPPADAAGALEAARASASYARLGALVVACGGAVLLFAAVVRRDPGAERVALALAVLGALAGLALASPLGDFAGERSVSARYEGGAFLERSPDVDFDDPPDPASLLGAFTGSRDFDRLDEPLEAGPVPARALDAWAVGVAVRGAAWEGDATPALASDLPARCALALVADERRELRAPGIAVWWRCVALETGEARLSVALPGGATGRATVVVSVVPSLDHAVTSSLGESLALLAFGAAAFGALAAWASRPEREE